MNNVNDRKSYTSNIMGTKTIKLSKIKITPEFRSCLPNPSKMREKYSYYITHSNLFKEPVILNNKNELVDGYTTYLLCKMIGIKKVEVTYEQEEYQRPKRAKKVLIGIFTTLLITMILIGIVMLFLIPSDMFQFICINIVSLLFGSNIVIIWKKIYNKLNKEKSDENICR